MLGEDRERRRGALAGGALQDDVAVHEAGQPPGDAEPEPRAAVSPGGRAVGLAEGVEYASQEFLGDAGSYNFV